MQRYITGLLGIVLSITFFIVAFSIVSENKSEMVVAISNAIIFGLAGIYLIITRKKRFKTHPATFGLLFLGIVSMLSFTIVLAFSPEMIGNVHLYSLLFIFNILITILGTYIYYKH